MSTQTDFDKELEQIFDEMNIYSSLNNFKSVIKQAVDTYVIGERREKLTITTAASAVSKIINQDSLRNDQRLALWGDK